MWFFSKPFPRQNTDEMNRFVDELAQIGKTDDFLSERPGSPFDRDCRHIRARQIGERIFEIGGADAMEWVIKKISKRNSKDLAAHLEACWYRIGNF
ncbi:MAG: hypothetical protein IKP86_02915 [Anaerolineaceae bacterium]|nr:hypothetical protein [Anaerolineaceae bacterium]